MDGETGCRSRCGPTSELSHYQNHHASQKRRRGEIELTSEELVQALDSAIPSQHTAELAVLNGYDFDLDNLRRLLLGLFSS